jgi:hypothetical protein
MDTLITRLTDAQRHALAMLGATTCVEAARLCDVDGEGASTVSTYLGLAGVRQAARAIEVGRMLREQMPA